MEAPRDRQAKAWRVSSLSISHSLSWGSVVPELLPLELESCTGSNKSGIYFMPGF